MLSFRPAIAQLPFLQSPFLNTCKQAVLPSGKRRLDIEASSRIFYPLECSKEARDTVHSGK